MRIYRIITALGICLLLCLSVRAAGNGEGSLTVTLMDGKGIVADGSLTLYKLEDDTEGTARALAEYVKQSNLPGQTQTIGESGIVLFDGLQRGVYLVVQKECATGYEAILPFLVRIPMEIDGQLLYHVQAYPKVAETSKPDAPQLPQTGQLRWPVPVLAVLGMGLFGLGLRNRKKR